MNYRFFLVTGSSLLVVPKTVSAVQVFTEVTMLESNLGWMNPGNATGILLSYAAAGGLVSLMAKTAQVKTVKPKDVLWWLGAGIIGWVGFTGSRELVTSLATPELGLLSAAAVSTVIGYQALRLKLPEYAFDTHIRGPRLRSSQEIQQAQGNSVSDLIPFGADTTPYKWENEHFIVFGNIGGGKTLFMQLCMAAIARRDNELWFVFDPKPQFVPYLEALGREVIILNPLDRRLVSWDIAQDINDEPTAETFATALVKQQGDEGFWVMSARALLTEVLMFFIRSKRDWDLRDILLTISHPEDLKRVVGRGKLNQIIAEGLEGKNDKTGTNDFMLTLKYHLKKFEPVAALMHSTKGERQISLKSLIKSENYGRKALVLGNDEDSRVMIKTYNGLMFEMLVNFTLSLPDDRDRRIWAWIDELASVAQYVGENLSRFQEKARSKGGCSFAATQSYPALVAKLGEHYTDQIIELSKRIAVAGGVEGKTAQVLSEVYFGEVQVVATQAGTTKEYETNSSWSVKEEEVRPTHSRTTVPLVQKELLHSSAIPKTGPENGLTGFFFGGPEGPHWHTYRWKELMSRMVQDDSRHSAYERVEMDNEGLELQLWTTTEREKWNLPLVGPDDGTDDGANDTDWGNPLDARFGEELIPRPVVLKILDFESEDLDELTADCGLGVGIESFSRSQIKEMMAKIGMQTMGIEFDWEDE